MGQHDKHLPRKDANKKVEGMGSRYGKYVTKGQGQGTKADAKAAKAEDEGK